MITEVIRDPRALRGVLRHPDVVREAQRQERTRGAVRLPLLLEHRLQLRTGQRDQRHVVDERQDRVGLGVGHHAGGVGRVGDGVAGRVLQVGTQAARVDDAEVGGADVGRQAVAQRVGHQVAQGRLGAAVLADRCARRRARVMSAVTEPTGWLPIFAAYASGGVHDLLDLRDARVRRRPGRRRRPWCAATFCAVYAETSPVAGSTVSVDLADVARRTRRSARSAGSCRPRRGPARPTRRPGGCDR